MINKRTRPLLGMAQFLMRLPKTHRELLDELVAEDPQQSRAGIIRTALEEYAERHRTMRPGAA
jgi:metal-responsive CopG/Arc/MetJ family transcriptional regulator